MKSEENTANQDMQELISLAKAQTQMGAMRTYMNSERTLSVWLRTAMGGMVLGIAIDRLGLWLQEIPGATQHHNLLTEIVGAAFVVYAILLVALCSWRFIAFCREYKKSYEFPSYHTAWLPVSMSLTIILFGIALLVIIFVVR